MRRDGSGLDAIYGSPDVDATPDWQPIPSRCRGRSATIMGTPGKDTIVGTPRRT